MGKGWHGESRRHSLARKGIKTAVNPKHNAMLKHPEYELVKAYQPKAFDKNVWAVHYHEKGKPYLDRYSKFTQVEAKNRKEAIIKAKTILKINDLDGDGMPDHLDCDPKDPKKQGFFDGIKKQIQEAKTKKEERREAELVKLRAKLEAREEKLEKEKELKLSQELLAISKKKELEEIRLKEKELDMLQAEISEKKELRRAKRISALKRGAVIGIRAAKRAGQEIAGKEKKLQKVELTKAEKERSTAEKIAEQRKKTKEEQVKKTREQIAALEAKERLIRKELSVIKK